ncbi:hypothetical protein HPB49_019372 [Dermacentor silvarum]|uniref:Uncharacterized protein n=1 Tax=Dermacentor silvarum TaxID=543639 RepID=A0ACB8CAT4_DERSI|nr:hypothetical protein HPB49_019372 [Dermacentor silvarum]
MDEFSCHGGLIVDEMKLSEHLSVNSEGHIDGFVNYGPKFDFITSDGATWNRKMWSLMGIKASLTETKCSTLHPVDPTGKLHFLSDFPHLIKCLRNGLLRSDYETPDGRVSLHFVRKAMALDGCSVTLQAMHGITGSHTNPNNFERMRVSIIHNLVQVMTSRFQLKLCAQTQHLLTSCGRFKSFCHRGKST